MAGSGIAKVSGWTHVYSGKVRDVYVPAGVSAHSGDDRFLIVASDRISAYDFVLPTEIPDKGKMLTQLTLWWFEQLADITPNHIISTDVPPEVEGRAMIVSRLRMFPVECIVRGYLTGSGLAEYRSTGMVCGVPLPPGIVESGRLEYPIFTPTSKARVGEHDENISFAEMSARVGEGAARELRAKSVATYARAREIAAEKGIIIADTKFEFGVSTEPGDDGVILGDEALTPDSSRFWIAEIYKPGEVQPSLDKQFVRDWLSSSASGWDPASGKQPPPLPDRVVEKTYERYTEVYERLVGKAWRP
ncbi:MAG: phosphoribosylaminoimidazolesuccinocarboxamide synthase [Actinomycetaceae bacterium]|nr:phosphoribosylaminoimidazolesuccinocarboxamide synthase [Actinomycetaceae bacterium]